MLSGAPPWPLPDLGMVPRDYPCEGEPAPDGNISRASPHLCFLHSIPPPSLTLIHAHHSSQAIGMAFTVVMHSAVGSRPEAVEGGGGSAAIKAGVARTMDRSLLPWCSRPGEAHNLQNAATNIFVPALVRLERFDEVSWQTFG